MLHHLKCFQNGPDTDVYVVCGHIRRLEVSEIRDTAEQSSRMNNHIFDDVEHREEGKSRGLPKCKKDCTVIEYLRLVLRT